MKSTLALILLFGIGLFSCQSKDAGVKPKEDVERLYQRFHGKYKVVSSVSSEPLDVNFDGVSSTSLPDEIRGLADYESQVELRIKSLDRPVFLFVQSWPEQYVNTNTGPTPQWNGWDLLPYNPAYSVNYAQQGSGYSFTFSEDLSQLLVTPNAEADTIRWVKPERVDVEAGSRLRLTNKRRIYTRQGGKEVTIITTYERFTMTT